MFFLQPLASAQANNLEFNPISFGGGDVSQAWMDFVGPEQVSPHYENFAMSRKWAIFMSGGFIGLNVLGSVVDLHWIMASAIIPFFYWMFTSYWTLEGRSSLVMPLLNRFYFKLAKYEMSLLQTYWVDNTREKIRANLAEAREQMDFYQVHSSYDEIKSESINRVGPKSIS